MEFLVVHDEYERGEREKRATARELDITDAIPQIEFLARTLRAATGDTKEEREYRQVGRRVLETLNEIRREGKRPRGRSKDSVS